jgi:hypothetical protein
MKNSKSFHDRNTREYGECNCICHSAPDVVIHIMPCCAVCKLCNKGITIGLMEEHLVICKKKRTEIKDTSIQKEIDS